MPHHPEWHEWVAPFILLIQFGIPALIILSPFIACIYVLKQIFTAENQIQNPRSKEKG